MLLPRGGEHAAESHVDQARIADRVRSGIRGGCGSSRRWSRGDGGARRSASAGEPKRLPGGRRGHLQDGRRSRRAAGTPTRSTWSARIQAEAFGPRAPSTSSAVSTRTATAHAALVSRAGDSTRPSPSRRNSPLRVTRFTVAVITRSSAELVRSPERAASISFKDIPSEGRFPYHGPLKF